MVTTCIFGILTCIGAIMVFCCICIIPIWTENRKWEKERQEEAKQRSLGYQFEKIEWEDPEVGNRVDLEAYSIWLQYEIKIDRQVLYKAYKASKEKKNAEIC